MVQRFVGLGKEVAYGGDVALTEFISAIDENTALDNAVIADFEMGTRGKPKPAPGPFKATGGFKFFVEPENCGLLLLALMGTETPSTIETGVYKHAFKISSTPQYLTMGIGTGVVAAQKTFPGYAVKKVKLSCAPRQKLLAEVDGFGKTINLDALASPSFSTKQPFHWVHASGKIATVANADIQAMTVEIENHWKEDEYTLGSRTLRKATLQGITVKGTMDILFDAKTQMELFLGAAAATQPAATLTKQRLDLNFTHDTLAGATKFFEFNIILLETLYNIHKANITKQDRTIENLEFECYAPTAGEQVEIDLQNTVISY